MVNILYLFSCGPKGRKALTHKLYLEVEQFSAWISMACVSHTTTIARTSCARTIDSFWTYTQEQSQLPECCYQSDFFMKLTLLSTTMTKVTLMMFLEVLVSGWLDLMQCFFQFIFCIIGTLVTWITTASSWRHLLYAYKLTSFLFVCMGTSEARPSRLLIQVRYGERNIYFLWPFWILGSVLGHAFKLLH